MGRLDGKVALITGASSGFGRAGALRFAKEGAKIVVVDKTVDEGKKTAEMVKAAGGEAIFVETDVSEAEACKNMIKRTIDEYGKLDIIWNNAGIQGECDWDISHCPADMINRYMDINVKGVWYGIHYAAPELVKTKGVILNTASIVATLGTLGCSTYGASKGAVRNLTYVVAYELGLHGVRCNCISPYCVDTPGVAHLGKEHYNNLLDGTALKRLPTVDEVINAALFLVSDEAAGITGFDLRVDVGAGVRTMPTLMDKFMKNNPYET